MKNDEKKNPPLEVEVTSQILDQSSQAILMVLQHENVSLGKAVSALATGMISHGVMIAHAVHSAHPGVTMLSRATIHEQIDKLLDRLDARAKEGETPEQTAEKKAAADAHSATLN